MRHQNYGSGALKLYTRSSERTITSDKIQATVVSLVKQTVALALCKSRLTRELNL